MQVTTVSSMTKGFNLIWTKHMAISAMADPTGNKLNLSCFPQDYIVSPLGKSGTNLSTLITSTTNKDTVSISTPNGKWQWVRCAVSWDMRSFYLAPNASKIMTPEIIYTGTNNDYPYRYFWGPEETTTMLLENQSLNTGTDIYIRNVYLFNDYLPNTYLFKNSLLTNVNNEQLSSLIYVVDFANLNIVDGSITYYTSLSIENTIASAGIGIGKTPTYDQTFVVVPLCDPATNFQFDGALGCSAISACPGSMNAELCSKDNTALACKDNYYLNTSSMSCASSCPSGTVRSQCSKLTNAICNFTCSADHSTCNFSSSQIINYNKNLVCKNSFFRVSYECFANIITESKNFK